MIGSSGFMITAIRVALGTASLRSARRFWVRSLAILLTPVTLPPGRARFVTNPVATGSPTSTMTLGTVFVAEMTARGSWRVRGDDEAHIEVQQFFGEGGEPVKLAVGE